MSAEELIPENNCLYRRVRPGDVDSTGQCPENAFMPRAKDKMLVSVDWCAKTTPEKSSIEPVKKIQFRLARVRVEESVNMGLEVKYDPILKPTQECSFINHAHTLIIGINSLTIASKLSEKAGKLII